MGWMNTAKSALPFPTGLKRDQWTVKSLHFLFWGAVGFYFPYINVYYRNIGLSGTEIGLINTLGPLLGAFSSTYWGVKSDRSGKTRLLFVIAGIGVILSTILMGQVHTFWWILPIAGMVSLFNSPLLTMLNSTTLELLGDNSADYGKYRVWGTIGFIFTSLGSGYLFKQSGLQAMFLAFPIVMLFFLAASMGLHDHPIQYVSARKIGLGQMIRQPAWMTFAASAFLLWLAANGSIVFLSVTIKDMGGSESLIGTAATVAAISEIPFLISSSSLLRRIGPGKLTGLSFAGYSLRILLYAIMPIPSWVLAINVMQAVTYVPFLIGTVAYANQLTVPELRATSQGVLATILSLAAVAGALVSGWIYDHAGPTGLYLTMTGFCLAALLLFVLKSLLTRKTSP